MTTLVISTVTLVAALAVMGWAVVIDGKRRWPHTRTWDRFVHIVAFDHRWMMEQTAQARKTKNNN